MLDFWAPEFGSVGAHIFCLGSHPQTAWFGTSPFKENKTETQFTGS